MPDCTGLDFIPLRIASDICYDPESLPSFIRILERLLRKKTAVSLCASPAANDQCSDSSAAAAYIATTVRNEETFLTFSKLIAHSELEMEDITYTMQPAGNLQYGRRQVGNRAEDSNECRIVLHRIT